jgi:alpha/beta superfamily hydrolase
MERHPGMNRISKTESLTFTGPAGTIEALMDAPAGDAIGMAVVCHPHPQHGGTMHNKVVHTVAREFARCGYTALRFNFRGTEGSEGAFDNGRGELEDALAAIEWLRDQCGSGPLWLAGFSFGAAIAIRAAVNVPVNGLISVAPAVRDQRSRTRARADGTARRGALFSWPPQRSADRRHGLCGASVTEADRPAPPPRKARHCRDAKPCLSGL